VSTPDLFVVCAPDAYHKDGDKQCSLASYNTRGWCRMELLAKVCATGLRDMYFLSGDPANPKFEKADPHRSFQHIPLQVFKANFSCCERKHAGDFKNCDKQQLVETALMLYSTSVKNFRTNPELKSVLCGMCRSQEQYFPKTYSHVTETGTETRELFGESIEIANDLLGLSYDELGLGPRRRSHVQRAGSAKSRVTNKVSKAAVVPVKTGHATATARPGD
jgi:hypothetical protein